MYMCYDCNKILKDGDEYKFKILCTDCFEEEVEESRMIKCARCGDTLNVDFGYETLCPECIKEVWVENRGERLFRDNCGVVKEAQLNITENEVMFEKIIHELFDLYSRKNRDYGNAFGQTFDEFGYTVSAIRLQDKLSRFKKLIATGSQEIKDESVRDTLVDLANYAIMTIMEMDKRG